MSAAAALGLRNGTAIDQIVTDAAAAAEDVEAAFAALDIGLARFGPDWDRGNIFT